MKFTSDRQRRAVFSRLSMGSNIFSKTADLLRRNMKDEFVARSYVLEKLDVFGEGDKINTIKVLHPRLEGTNALDRFQVISILEDLDEEKGVFSKRPKKLGSVWIGGAYVHGPRIRQPDEFEFIKNVEPSRKSFHMDGSEELPKDLPKGSKIVVGKLKGSGDWAVQSTLIPKSSALGRKLIKK